MAMSRSSCMTDNVPDRIPKGRFSVVFNVAGRSPGGTGNDSVVWLVSPKNHSAFSEPASLRDSVVMARAGSGSVSGCACTGGATQMNRATAVIKAPARGNNLAPASEILDSWASSPS